MPKDETFPIPTKYIDVTTTTNTSLDVMIEKQIEDYWNVDGEKELSDAWTGFTRFILLNERPPEGFTWSGRETYEETKKLIVLTMCGQICENLRPMQPRRKQNKNAQWRNQNAIMPDN